MEHQKKDFNLLKRPHNVHDDFLLSKIYLKDNSNVKYLYDKIKKTYNERYQINKKKIEKHQKYDWNILIPCIEENIDKKILTQYINKIDEDEKINIEDEECDNNLIKNQISIVDILDKTYELRMEFNVEDKDITYNLIESVRNKRDEVINAIQTDNEIKCEFFIIHCDFLMKNELLIIRAANQSSIDKIQQKWIPKYRRKWDTHLYDVKFNKLEKSEQWVQHYCGNIPLSVPQSYSLDDNLISDKIKKSFKNKNNIKLLVLNGCHSYGFAKLFKKYVECIVCVHPNCEVENQTAEIFAEHFYIKFAKNANKCIELRKAAIDAFNEAVEITANNTCTEKDCRLHIGHQHHCPNNNKESKHYHQQQKPKVKESVTPTLLRNITPTTGNSLIKKINNYALHEQLEFPSINDEKKEQKLDTIVEEKTESLTDDTFYVINQTHPETTSLVLTFKSRQKKNKFDKFIKKEIKNHEKFIHENNILSSKNKEKLAINYKKYRWKIGQIDAPCCCNTYNPHNVQDKYMFLLDGEIFSRKAKILADHMVPNGTSVKSASVPRINTELNSFIHKNNITKKSINFPSSFPPTFGSSAQLLSISVSQSQSPFDSDDGGGVIANTNNEKLNLTDRRSSNNKIDTFTPITPPPEEEEEEEEEVKNNNKNKNKKNKKNNNNKRKKNNKKRRKKNKYQYHYTNNVENKPNNSSQNTNSKHEKQQSHLNINNFFPINNFPNNNHNVRSSNNFFNNYNNNNVK